MTTGFVLIVNDRNIPVVKKEFEHEMFDNANLACGYVEHEAGITFEVLCMGEYSSDGKVDLRRGNSSTSIKLRYDGITGVIVLVEDEIMPAFQDKIDIVRETYAVNEAIMKSRNTFELDDFRHAQYPDDGGGGVAVDELTIDGYMSRKIFLGNIG